MAFYIPILALLMPNYRLFKCSFWEVLNASFGIFNANFCNNNVAFWRLIINFKKVKRQFLAFSIYEIDLRAHSNTEQPGDWVLNSCFFSKLCFKNIFYKVVQLIGTFQNKDFLVPICTVQIPAFIWSLNLAFVCEKLFLKGLFTAF